MDSKQIVDALTSHIALYSSSASCADANPNPRNVIVRWLSTLSVPQRQSHLTILDPPFLKILLQMHSKNLTSGPSLFFILPDLPSSSDPSLPTLCSRRSRGLLLRSQEADEGARSIFASLRLFGSKEGKDECEIDSAVMSEELVADLGRFMEVMDGVSNGGFLRGEVEGMGSAWAEAEWLKEKGYYSLESFVVNRIELALRLSWRVWNGEKKQKGRKVKGSGRVGAGVAANTFWRKKGCVDWFLGLDPGVRKRMCLTFLTKGAKTLVKESLKSSDDFSKSGMRFSKATLSFPHKYDSLPSFKWRNPLPRQKDNDFSLNAMSKSFSENSILPTWLRDLIVLQQIADVLLISQSSELGTDSIFFSTLTSVETISDCILRRFRGFLMVVSSDCVEFELTRDTSMNTPKKKPEQKSAIASHSQRGKNKCHKRVNPAKKSQNNPAIESNKIKHNLHEKECLDTTISALECGPPKDIECEIICNAPTCAQYSQSLSSGHSLVNYSQFEGSAVTNKKEGATELVDDTSCIKKKRGGRRGSGSKNTSLKKTTNKVGKSPPFNDVTSVTEVKSVCIDNPGSSMSTSVMVQVNLPSQQIFANADNESKTIFDKEVNNDSAVEYSTSVFVKNHHTSDEYYQILDRPIATGASNNACTSSENTRDSNLVRKSSPVTREVTGSNLRDTVTSDMSMSDDTNTATYGPVTPVCECDVCFGTEVDIHNGSRSVTENVLQTIEPAKLFGEVIYDGHSISQTEDTSCYPCMEATTVGITSCEHPSVVSLHSQVLDSNNLPATTDRLHLDADYNQPNHFHRSLFPGRQQVRNTTESGGGYNMSSLTSSQLNQQLDWPPLVRSCRRSSQPGISNHGSVYNSKLQPTLCSGITNNGMQFKGLYSDNERRLFGDVDLSGFQNQNASEMVDDSERHWMSDEETDMQTISGDYNKYFGGGVMYWNTSDNAGTGFSRPPSHSSEDGSWAWYDADLNRAIDDMVGLPAPYGVNGMSSPTAASFCSPFESLGPGQQSLSYVISGNDVSALDCQATADLSEESVSGTLNTSTCNSNEGIKGDSLPYPILRPIIIPSLSRKSSRSEFKLNGDHRSPCLASSRRDPPQLKRPPSPVVLCVPRAPRVPPPSVGESRKHRGFPVVRSGSSSPRHWGMRNGYHEEINNEDVHHCMDIPEVVWASWGDKSLSGNARMQDISGTLLQDRLIAISQLGRDQEHPDVALPVQPPEPVNCPWKTSLSRMQSFLHEEISSFCKKVATENHAKKPFINWAVKRVARSLQVLWPRSRTNLFGSNATGLALPTSDVDLVVCLPPVRNLEPIKEAGILEGRNGIKETCLQHAARYLANQDWVKNDSLKIIENTAIPLIMLVVEVPIDFIGSRANISTTQPLDTLPAVSIDPSNLHFRPIHLDISFKSPSHTGLQTTELVRELTKQFPASIPLSLILKQFLADRSLDHSYSGGLSSYCLVLLITRFLQHECHLGRPLNQNLGVLLMDFLYFYGNVFDPRQMRISIQGNGLYMTRERGHSIDPIHIDDPLCPTNNVGRNCFRIHQCIKAFADAYSALESEIVHFPSNSDSRMCTFKLLPKIIPSINHQE